MQDERAKNSTPPCSPPWTRPAPKVRFTWWAWATWASRPTCAPWTYADVIANTTGMDALLDGHSHSLIEQVVMQNKDGEDVLLAACGTKLGGIGYARISAADGTIQTGRTVPVDQRCVRARAAGPRERRYHRRGRSHQTLDEKLGEVVAKSDVDLVINDPEAVDENGQPSIIPQRRNQPGRPVRRRLPRSGAGADVAFVNGGGIRVSIDAGDITPNDILLVHPFGNALCVVEATGQQILDALEWGARNVPETAASCRSPA